MNSSFEKIAVLAKNLCGHVVARRDTVIMKSGMQMQEHAASLNLDKDSIQKKVSKVSYWRYPIKLGDVVTPGTEPMEYLNFKAQSIPSDLTGKSVLDIGAWDGYFSFLAEQRGASRILAIDNLQHQRTTEGFQTLKEILMSKVEYKVVDVYEIENLGEVFDVVFYFDVYYHLQDPMLAFKKILSVMKKDGILCFSGHVIVGKKPVMYMYDPYELANDPTNYWGATVSCLEKMCYRVGFKKVELLSRRWDRVLFRAYK